MRTLPAGLATWLAANNVTHRADTFKVTLADGTIYRWTTFETDLVISANTFLAGGTGAAPLVKRGPYSQNSRLVIDTLDLELLGKGFTIGGIALPLKAAQGYFDFARVQVDHIIMPTPGDVTTFGPIASFFEGRVAQVEPVGPNVHLRLKSELEALNVMLPKFLAQPACGNVIYDTNCALVKASWTDPGTVSSSTTTTVTTGTAAITAKAADFYNGGVIRFTSGALSGLRRAIADWATPTLTLALPLPSAPAGGVTFDVYPNCLGQKTQCNSKFSNLVHFRGYPHVPTQEGGS